MKNNKVSVIYVRFSAEDGEDNNGARSIENQIKFLTKYANNNGFSIVKIYSDIGKTGTNMNRPGLQELYSDMKKGLFNTIIVKDLSRFSRNYIEAGNYLEYIFPASNIRFISVVDNYDSANKTEDESIILRNFLNSMYSKDIKKKIHKSIKRRVNSDDLTFVVKYGFKRDEKGKIVIDEYSANIVRRIFTEAIDGINAAEIARRLENDKIYTPSAYKKFVLKVKPNRDPEPDKLYKWDPSVIRRMLGDLEYCGHAVNIVKRKSRVVEQQNIVVKNKRPVIIDEETFNKAPKYYITRPSKKKRYMKALIYCKTCGKLMYYHETKRKDQATYYCCKCHTKIDGDLLKELLYKDAIAVLKESKLTPDEFLKRFIENHSPCFLRKFSKTSLTSLFLR